MIRIDILHHLFSGFEKKKKVRVYSKGIGLSVCPSKHLGFGFRVILETLIFKVVRVSHKTLV